MKLSKISLLFPHLFLPKNCFDSVGNRGLFTSIGGSQVAVFSSRTLEDQVVLTHCYPAAGPCTNPVALGTRWLAYAEKRLVALHRSGGGFEGEGIQSYTATVIHAAKSITKVVGNPFSLMGPHVSRYVIVYRATLAFFTDL